jgi:hypothetical protein
MNYNFFHSGLKLDLVRFIMLMKLKSNRDDHQGRNQV